MVFDVLYNFSFLSFLKDNFERTREKKGKKWKIRVSKSEPTDMALTDFSVPLEKILRLRFSTLTVVCSLALALFEVNSRC
jgi:hypothetical protein